jgi:molybdopterin adenylyltransferase
MSVKGHRAEARTGVACFVLTVSDTRTATNDLSGDAIATLLEGAGHRVARRALVRDDPSAVITTLRPVLQDAAIEAVITTGGTGISRRDSTAETVEALIDKPLPGFGELFRVLSFETIGSAAMLSRATAGAAGHQAIFVLPGSEDAVRLAMTRLILPELGHIVRELTK